jgi:uncharacterized protein YndB with AHSA1/START domain
MRLEKTVEVAVSHVTHPGIALSSSSSNEGVVFVTQSDTISAGTRDMIISRRFEAPVERVWQAWTEPDQVRQWWGPAGFTAPLAEMDVREGGASLVCMRAPWGQDFYNTWTYETIVPTARLDFVQRFADQHGNPIEPTTIGLPPDLPAVVPHRITFTAVDGNATELTVVESGYASESTVELSRMGMNQCLDKMATLVSEL